MRLQKSKGIALFTDGSAYHKDRSGGWAWVAFDAFGNEEQDSGGEGGTTSNRMEMTAWIRGLNSLFEALGPCRILVYSDSQYVGFGATNISRNRRKNIDLWYDLDTAKNQHDYIEFCWIKGHAHSHYNHLVDELAGQARVNFLLKDIRDDSPAPQS